MVLQQIHDSQIKIKLLDELKAVCSQKFRVHCIVLKIQTYTDDNIYSQNYCSGPHKCSPVTQCTWFEPITQAFGLHFAD